MPNNIPTQTSQNSRSSRRVKPARMSQSTMDSLKKLGLDKLSAAEKARYAKNFYARKQLCKTPEEIKAAHPDKHFVWINMNKLEKQGNYHPNGYKLFRGDVDTENLNKEKFDHMNDGLVHRNEMVLAYLPMAEYEEQQIERAVIRATRDMGDVLTQSDALRGFAPHATVVEDKVDAEGN